MNAACGGRLSRPRKLGAFSYISGLWWLSFPRRTVQVPTNAMSVKAQAIKNSVFPHTFPLP